MTKFGKSNNAADYTGRFAPSPTGPLHFGSLVAALASYLDARAHRGRWLLRIEDLDPPREVRGSADQIIASLKAHGLHWDGPICRQSQRSGAYHAALAELDRRGACYPCNCSRARLATTGGIYRGHCRRHPPPPDAEYATRIRVDSIPVEFQDIIQGPQSSDLAQEVGDFVVRRRDGLFAYQLAVVVDDAAQGVTHIIRGADLLDSSPRQIYLQQQLGLPTPVYGHIPVATNDLGQKLSKQNLADALDGAQAVANLLAALDFLGQPSPAAAFADPGQLLAWATERWRRQAIPRVAAVVHRGLSFCAGRGDSDVI